MIKISSRSGANMRRGFCALAVGLALLPLCSCGGGKEKDSFPSNVNEMSDIEIVDYMMKRVSPDSVARFICRASLGKIEGVKIDTLANATLYAYENYKDDNLQTFAAAYDEYSEGLPLDEKVTLRKLAAVDDPMGLGYTLGLEYVNSIRADHKNAKEVEAEIAALKRACEKNPEDSLTFKRFMTGFKVALEYDGSNEIPMEIYQKYK